MLLENRIFCKFVDRLKQNEMQVLFFFNVFILIGILLYCYLDLRYAEGFTDSPYYLMMARFFAGNGNIYGQMPAGFTPFGAMILSIPYFFSKNPDYSLFQGIQILFIFVSGIQIYYIIRKTKLNKGYCIFFALSHIFVVLQLCSRDIKLEPFVLVFLLMALIALDFKNTFKYFFVGFFIFLAFWCKQYGLFLFPVAFFAIFTEEDQKWRNNLKKLSFNISMLIGGFVLPLILSLFFLVYTNNRDVFYFLRSYSGTWKKVGIGLTGIGWNYFDLIRFSLNVFIRYSPFILIPFLILLLDRSNSFYLFKDRKIQIFILTICFSLLRLKFAYYNYYFILLTPFCMLFVVHFLVLSANKAKIIPIVKMSYLLFFVPVFISFYFTAGFLHSTDKKENRRIEQLRISKEINKYVPPYSPAIIVGMYYDHALIYLSKLNPANKDKLGSGEADGYLPKQLIDNMIKGSYIIINMTIGFYKDYQPFINKKNFIYIHTVGDYLISKKIDCSIECK